MKNKRLASIVFLVGATLFNLLILLAISVLLMATFSFLYRNIENVSMGLSLLAIVIILVGSIGGTFIIYSRVAKWFLRKRKP